MLAKEPPSAARGRLVDLPHLASQHFSIKRSSMQYGNVDLTPNLARDLTPNELAPSVAQRPLMDHGNTSEQPP